MNVPVFASGLKQFRIIATSPLYDIGEDNCQPDFTSCPPSPADARPTRPDRCVKVYDDGTTVLEVCEVDRWWRGKDMKVTVVTKTMRGHYLRLYRKIADEPSFPQVLALYQDGNLRLKPHPPQGRRDVCFGSSVVLGPARPSERPYVDIAEVKFDPSTLSLKVIYVAQGATHLSLDVSREAATVTAEVRYPCDDKTPFSTFRSMWVADGNADVDHVRIATGDFPVLSWGKLKGPSWFFHRTVRSRHNTSAPDVRIEVIR